MPEQNKRQAAILLVLAVVATIGFTAFVYANTTANTIAAKYSKIFSFAPVVAVSGLYLCVAAIAMVVRPALRFKRGAAAVISLPILLAAAINQFVVFTTVNAQNRNIFKFGRDLDLYEIARENLHQQVSTKIASMILLSRKLEGARLIMNRSSADRWSSFILTGQDAEITSDEQLPMTETTAIQPGSDEDFDFFPMNKDGSSGYYLTKSGSFADTKLIYVRLNDSIYIK